MDINCKVNSKANPIKVHKYYFKVMGNRESKEEDRAYVMVKSLTSGDITNFLNFADGRTSYDFPSMFSKQVKSVHKVFNTLTKKEMTKDEIVNSPFNQTLVALITDVGTHLISESQLDEEEEKN